MKIIAGPFLPEPAWQRLQTSVLGLPQVQLLRQVPDMVLEMRQARLSLSQCGYNTALDIVCAGVPALVVPYATRTENEQSVRAERLSARGALRRLNPSGMDASALANALQRLLDFKPSASALWLDGAERSAQLIAQRVGRELPA
jgi:predicted glycosyltransferase